MNQNIIAIPVLGESPSFNVSPLFSRSSFFLIFNEENENIKYLNNEYSNSKIQSGKMVSKFLIDKNVTTFCGIDIGFNVQKVAKENNIQLIVLPENRETTANSILKLLKNKKRINH